jgi:CMP-N,N'-diacetyllegionaminic acid synthase
MINNKRILSVITARAGSQGIPMKNVKELFGYPLFMWSVFASVKSEYVDRTVISSNCPYVEKEYNKMMKTAEEWQMDTMKNVVFCRRPDDISGPLSKNEEALIHALHWIKKEEGVDYDVVVNLQPTSPCRTDNLLDSCIKAYEEGGYDSLLTARKDTPFLWQFINNKWEYTVDKNDCCNRKMRQEFEENEFVLHDCGSVFMTDTNVLLETGCRIGKNPCIFEVNSLNSLQIDSEFDFCLIENMAKIYNFGNLV